jgi:acylphosphatase
MPAAPAIRRGFSRASRAACKASGTAPSSMRNLPSGEVELEVEGPRATLESLLQELHTGPPACRVRQIHVEWAPARGIHGFEIRRI